MQRKVFHLNNIEVLQIINLISMMYPETTFSQASTMLKVIFKTVTFQEIQVNLSFSLKKLIKNIPFK